MDAKRKEEFLRKRQAYTIKKQQLNEDILVAEQTAQHWNKEYNRIYNLLNSPEAVIKELNIEFSKKTSLSASDMSFLFFAVALQCTRILLQPKVKMQFEKIASADRHDAGKDGNEEFRLGKKRAKTYADSIKSEKYPDKETMFLLPVPYDAMEGTENIVISGVTSAGKNIYGGNHHTATIGHDPILGYVFGTINILSRTITFKTPLLDSNLVHMKYGTARGQYVGEKIGFNGALERALESVQEDVSRIYAAVIRQAMHMQSDKYTKHGLPIPFIKPEVAQEMLEQGWNSYELERVSKLLANNVKTIGLQASVSILINEVVYILYKLIYYESERDQRLMEVKIRKIISYSNVIASTSNIINVAVTKNVDNLDMGGLAVTLYRIATDTKMINQIRDEYVYGGYEKQLDFLEI